MKKLTFYLATMFQPLMFSLVAIGLMLFLLSFRLGALTPGLSEAEINYRAYTSQAGNITSELVYAPHAFVQNALQQISITNRALLRAASIGFALLSVVSVFALLRLWHAPKLAILGTVLYLTSSWFLHTARVATPDILFTLLPVLLLIWTWLLRSRRRELALFLVVIACGILLYIPGMAWFIVTGIIWQAGRIAKELRTVSAPYIISSIVMGLLFILPAGLVIYQNNGLLWTFMGLPETLPPISTIAKNIMSIPLMLFLRGPSDSAMWLGRLPLLDLFSAAFLILGVYTYSLRLNLDRSRFLFAGSILGAILFSLDGPVTIAIILPFIYIFIAGGLAFMLNQWFAVFPRNPFARNIGGSLLTIAVLMSIFYHINHYFIAWPNTPETKQVYSQRL
jgi:hypothetical protein